MLNVIGDHRQAQWVSRKGDRDLGPQFKGAVDRGGQRQRNEGVMGGLGGAQAGISQGGGGTVRARTSPGSLPKARSTVKDESARVIEEPPTPCVSMRLIIIYSDGISSRVGA